VKALVTSARELGKSFDLLEAVESDNSRQKLVLLEKLKDNLGPDLAGKRVGVWGLAFKAETDDMRESPAIPLIQGIIAAGATVQAHDPKAMDSARSIFGSLRGLVFAADPYSAVEGADALVIVTEWLVYRNPDFERLKNALKRPLVIDGRNLFDPARLHADGFEYHSIGRRRP
jgi:UDPglucose 6-dehydrogenase